MSSVGVDTPSVAGRVLGGGSPTPPPEGLLWSSDFKGGVYLVGETPVTVADMWGTDDTNWGPFDPATDIIDGTGLVGTNSASVCPILAGVALTTSLANGTTYLFYCRPPVEEGIMHLASIDLFDTDFIGDRYAEVRRKGSGDGSDFGRIGYPAEDAPNNPTPVGTGAVIKVGITLTDGKAAMSTAGSDVDELLNQEGWDTSPTTIGIFCYSVIEKIEAYAPVDNATLKTMSA